MATYAYGGSEFCSVDNNHSAAPQSVYQFAALVIHMLQGRRKPTVVLENRVDNMLAHMWRRRCTAPDVTAALWDKLKTLVCIIPDLIVSFAPAADGASSTGNQDKVT